jgi:two-component system, OmpR family, sensor histidine kinase CssS
MQKSKRSMKIRLLSTVTLLLTVVFALIYLIFNFFFTQYIETTATALLTQSRESFVAKPPAAALPAKDIPIGDSSIQEEKPEKNREPHSAFAASVQRTIVSADFEVLFPQNQVTGFDDNSGLSTFIDGLKDSDISLSNTDSGKIELEDNLYYYTVASNSAEKDSYAVFFINMSDLYVFEQTLNQLLLIIMVIGLIIIATITYVFVSRITKPLQTLALFAKEIGEGNYQTIDEEFVDLELHELKTAMNETTKKLKHYDANQRTFFQNASHELRTPLQIIKTNAEGIEIGIIDDKKGAVVIKKETDKLGSLVEDILYLSRLESRSADRIATTNDLRETFSYTAERYASVIAQKNITLHFDFQKNPVFFHYDENDFERAFQNLLSNALRYAVGTIRLGCKEVDDRIMITVYNDGPPISRTDLPHIFDRFYKGEGGINGIGLSIVQSIVHSYGGRIEAKSSEQGTTFTIILSKPQG